MRHINLAVEDMFNTAHMQLLMNCCQLDKMLLASLLLELRAKGTATLVLKCSGGLDPPPALNDSLNSFFTSSALQFSIRTSESQGHT